MSGRLRRNAWKILAVAGPLVVIAALGFGLTRDPSEIRSVTVGRAAPDFELPRLANPAGPGGGAPVRLADYRGRVLVVNFWASWCVSCRLEHDVLVELGERLADRGEVALLGVNYRDTEDAANRFLASHGEYPYPSGVDPRGRTGIDFGVYGLPETYFLDAEQVVRARHIGPIDRESAWRYLAELGIEP